MTYHNYNIDSIIFWWSFFESYQGKTLDAFDWSTSKKTYSTNEFITNPTIRPKYRCVKFWLYLGWIPGLKIGATFLRIFWYMWKVCRIMSPYSNTHANAKKMIFDIQYLGNWFEFGIISNDFWSSTIWASHIRLLLSEVETPKKSRNWTYISVWTYLTLCRTI